MICLTTTVACLGTFHKPVPSPFEKLVPVGITCARLQLEEGAEAAVPKQGSAALFPFHPLCYTANVEVGERVRVALLASPNCKTKQKKTGLVDSIVHLSYIGADKQM